nr:hypothetical protein [Tanacetum cinerariifolium]
MNYYEPNPCYDSSGFEKFQPTQSVIDHLNLQKRINDSMIEFRGTFQAWLQQQKGQVVNLDSYSPKPLQCRKIPIYYDDDNDEESSTPLRDIFISELPLCIVITPVLSTKETKVSLLMGDKHLDTIPEKESDEFIKSSVENLVPNLSEPEDLSILDIDLHHFNAESDLIESLLNQDSLIISSSKIDSFLDEFAGELIFLKSIPPGIDEADCDPEDEIYLIEKLFNDSLSLPENESSHFDIPSSPLPPAKPPDDDEIEPDLKSMTVKVDSDSLMEEIDLYFNADDPMPPGIEDDDDDSERDIPILEELLDNYSLSLPTNESHNFDIPSPYRHPAKPPDGLVNKKDGGPR